MLAYVSIQVRRYHKQQIDTYTNTCLPLQCVVENTKSIDAITHTFIAESTSKYIFVLGTIPLNTARLLAACLNNIYE